MYGSDVHALSFNYGQRHAVELQAAAKIAKRAGVSHEILALPDNILASTSPLVNKTYEVGQYANANELPGGIEPTFIPGRNALFLTLAANRAAALGARHIVTGVCEADSGGYPDCRAEFITKLQEALALGIFNHPIGLAIYTPLMHLTKKQSVELAQQLPGCMDALADSHTCYTGGVPACGKCHACIIRARGFLEAAVPDPLITAQIAAGLLPQEYNPYGAL